LKTKLSLNVYKRSSQLIAQLNWKGNTRSRQKLGQMSVSFLMNLDNRVVDNATCLRLLILKQMKGILNCHALEGHHKARGREEVT
jgi:hypothetical protein